MSAPSQSATGVFGTSVSSDCPSEIVLWGGTGQAKVIRPVLEAAGRRVVAVIDDTPGLPPPFPDIPVLLGRDGLEAWLRAEGREVLGFVVTIGNPHGRVRLRLHDQLVERGLVPVSVVHPTAFVDPSVALGPGAQIHAGAILMPESRVGRQVIVNTRASLDHESVLGDGCELAPGATLCGSVLCDTNAWVCAGATVLPRVRIGADAVVGAGAVVRRDVAAGTTVVGVPARVIGRAER